MQNKLDEIQPIETATNTPTVDPIRQEYEQKAAQKGIGILKELSASPERKDYFGNPLEFTESMTGLLRESLDRSITSEAYYDIESELQKASKNNPPVTEEEFKSDPNLFREGIKYHSGYTYEWHANRAKRFDERREIEEVSRYSSGWQKVVRFIAGMGADIITDPIPNLAVGGLGAAFTKTISKAFVAAGIENLLFDEIIDYFKADRLIDEGEQPKTFEERNIERAGAFLLGGALGAGTKALGNVIDKAKARKQPESEIVNGAQLNSAEFQPTLDPYRTQKLSTQDASDKVTDLSKAMQQMQAMESLDTKKLSNLENTSSFLKSNEALVARAGKIEKIELPKDFKVHFLSKPLEVNYKVVDLDLLIKSNELSGKVDKLYPPELAPSERATTEDINRIRAIGDNLNPEEMILSNNLVTGSPLISKENVIIKGNNRANGLDYAFEIQNAFEYTDALRRMFPQYDIDGMTKPMLVREIQTALTPEQLKELKNLKADTLNAQKLTPQSIIDPDNAEKALEKALLQKVEPLLAETQVQLSPENSMTKDLSAAVEDKLTPEYRAEFREAIEFEKQLNDSFKNVLNCIKK
jgi:hypothetical protein